MKLRRTLMAALLLAGGGVAMVSPAAAADDGLPPYREAQWDFSTCGREGGGVQLWFDGYDARATDVHWNVYVDGAKAQQVMGIINQPDTLGVLQPLEPGPHSIVYSPGEIDDAQAYDVVAPSCEDAPPPPVPAQWTPRYWSFASCAESGAASPVIDVWHGIPGGTGIIWWQELDGEPYDGFIQGPFKGKLQVLSPIPAGPHTMATGREVMGPAVPFTAPACPNVPPTSSTTTSSSSSSSASSGTTSSSAPSSPTASSSTSSSTSVVVPPSSTGSVTTGPIVETDLVQPSGDSALLGLVGLATVVSVTAAGAAAHLGRRTKRGKH